MLFACAPKTIAATGAGVLALGCLAVGAGPVAAAELTTTYTCTAPVLGTGDYSGSLTVAIPTTVVSGTAVASRPLGLSVTIPDATMDAARSFGVTSISGSSTDVTYRVGTTSHPVTGVDIPDTAVPADGPLTVSTTATASGFTAPAPGVYDVKVPLDFSVSAVAQSGLGPVPVTITCALKSGAPETIATVTVTANPTAKIASTTSVKVANPPVTTTKHAKLSVTVKASGRVPTGKVTAKLGTKVLKTGTLSSGKVTLKLPLLSKGTKTIVVRYAGDAKVLPSKRSITITVKRG